MDDYKILSLSLCLFWLKHSQIVSLSLSLWGETVCHLSVIIFRRGKSEYIYNWYPSTVLRFHGLIEFNKTAVHFGRHCFTCCCSLRWPTPFLPHFPLYQYIEMTISIKTSLEFNVIFSIMYLPVLNFAWRKCVVVDQLGQRMLYFLIDIRFLPVGYFENLMRLFAGKGKKNNCATACVYTRGPAAYWHRH